MCILVAYYMYVYIVSAFVAQRTPLDCLDTWAVFTTPEGLVCIGMPVSCLQCYCYDYKAF